ncbi:TadE/TadG family type IV pilus assembly protein [Vibrio hangzhouensis]|uniref:Flp pilus assembly protein TadG n=1 Tax=Vibrio hangzhouensis TaxID=462991 RepID=A0A1H5YLL2_9VIBR|nr:TadE/TadG family type IV pilus assembly protein [Vibrio hangzhouensis]SEG24387.1 Flp pilus assembly protein TadG [Vibrio hangzhouensis]
MSSSLTKHRGLAAIEFVLISPLIIVFIAICADIGNLLVEYQSLNKAVRNGARFAVTEIYGTATAVDIAPISEIQNVVVYGTSSGGTEPILEGLTPEAVTVTAPTSIDTTLVVTAVYTYSPTFLTIPFLDIPMTIDFTASAVMETGI